MSIDSALKKWLSSPAGKEKLREVQATSLKSGKSFGHTPNGVPVSIALAKKYAEDMINEVISMLPSSLKYSENPITRSSFLEPVVIPDTDGFAVKISFNPSAVHRDSLVPEVWNDGIPNIVVHLSNGWSARGAVYGEWHGKDTWSRAEYGGDLFMSEAVDSFNRTHPLAVAELGSEYDV